MFFQVILVFHVMLAIGLVALILLQHGKGADAGAAFGSGAAGSLFGARTANSFLYKLTVGLGVAFFITSLTLAFLASGIAPAQQSGGVIEETLQNENQISQPAAKPSENQNPDVPAMDLQNPANTQTPNDIPGP